MTTVGVIVNPLAGKDIRRLVANASPVSDASKVGLIRRAVAGAAAGGARRIVINDDHHALGRRAVADLDVDARIELLAVALSGDRLDTVEAALELAKLQVRAVVVFGGDGTNRDVAAGWPDAPLVPVSTGTNNVFPRSWDATSAGTAAALVASGAVALDDVAVRAKRILVHIEDGGHPVDDVALVDVALVDMMFTGARAIWRPEAVRAVVAAIATPASTGLSSIAGRTHPVGRSAPGGVSVRLGPGGRRVRMPLTPGAFAAVDIAECTPIAPRDEIEWSGPGVVALDGERTHELGPDARVTISIDHDGPMVIDVERALDEAVRAHHFDVPATEVPDGQ